MDIIEMKAKLATIEDQKTKLEGVYAQLIGQLNLMKTLIVEEETKNQPKEQK